MLLLCVVGRRAVRRREERTVGWGVNAGVGFAEGFDVGLLVGCSIIGIGRSVCWQDWRDDLLLL